MSVQAFWPKRVDRQTEGEVITVAEHAIRPVVRVSGRLGHFAGKSGLGGGGWLKITPVRAIVHNAAGDESVIDVPDVNSQAVRRMVITAALVAAGSLLASLALRRRTNAL